MDWDIPLWCCKSGKVSRKRLIINVQYQHTKLCLRETKRCDFLQQWLDKDEGGLDLKLLMQSCALPPTSKIAIQVCMYHSSVGFVGRRYYFLVGIAGTWLRFSTDEQQFAEMVLIG